MAKQSRTFEITLAVGIPIIILLAWAAIAFHNNWNTEFDKRVAAEAKAADAQKKESEKVREAITLKELIGYQDDTDIQTIEKIESGMADENNKNLKGLTSYLVGYEGAERSYHKACEYLQTELNAKQKELDEARKMIQVLEANLNNVSTLYDSIAQKHDQDRQNEVRDRENEQRSNMETVDNFQKKVADVVREKDQLQQDAEAKIAQSDAEREAANKDYARIRDRNKELVTLIHNMTRSDFDVPHGKITGVNQGAGTVLLNLGEDEGLKPRTIFTVYDSAITGISLPAPSTQQDVGIDSVYKREDAPKGTHKASIEVTKILGPHMAEARILVDQLQNPIIPDDVIYTPVWRPGQRQRFALTNGMHIEGLGERSAGGSSQNDLNTVIALIEANGGIVDAHIDPDGNLVGAITNETTYLVDGDVSQVDPLDKSMVVRSDMKKAADEMAVRSISLKELLRMMGWKNVTPVKGYGKFATQDDMTVPVETRVPSSGSISPIFTKGNVKARVKPEDRPRPVSDGTVSDLYKGTHPMGTSSSGNVSELFRSRKPAATKSE